MFAFVLLPWCTQAELPCKQARHFTDFSTIGLKRSIDFCVRAILRSGSCVPDLALLRGRSVGNEECYWLCFAIARVARRETEPQRERKSDVAITRPYKLLLQLPSKFVLAEREALSLTLSGSLCCTTPYENVVTGAPCC